MGEDKNIRAFIAIELPVKIIHGLKKIQDELKDESNKVAWAKPENIHLTIKFLGDIAADKVEDIESALEKAVNGVHRFSLSVMGIGAFPAMNNPRVVWIGVEQVGAGLKPALTELGALYHNLEQNLATLGFAKEERNFTPHLTLGRIKFLNDKKLFKERIEKYNDINLGQFEAEGICLFQSKLTPNGAVYEKLKEVKLK